MLDDQGGLDPQGGSAPGAETQAPLLLQDMQSPLEGLSVPKRRRTSQGIIVGMLVVGAVAAIFAMRQFGMGPATSLAAISLEYEPDAQQTTASPGKILHQLAQSRTAVQVPAIHIKQDPFELSSITPVDDGNQAERERLERQRQQEEERRLAAAARRQEIEDALSDLTLQSVMQGRVPVAMISGEMCREGSSVGDHFTLVEIGDRSVTLETVDGDRLDLSIDNRPDGARGRRN